MIKLLVLQPQLQWMIKELANLEELMILKQQILIQFHQTFFQREREHWMK